MLIDGVIKLPSLHVTDAKDAKLKRHGDGGIAGALMWFASRQEGGKGACAGSDPEARETYTRMRRGMLTRGGGIFGNRGSGLKGLGMRERN